MKERLRDTEMASKLMTCHQLFVLQGLSDTSSMQNYFKDVTKDVPSQNYLFQKNFLIHLQFAIFAKNFKHRTKFEKREKTN